MDSGILHQLNWPLRYNWNIVERGVKHYKPPTILYKLDTLLLKQEKLPVLDITGFFFHTLLFQFNCILYF